ncbi:alpha/beta fold hydrolase [Antrihabitans cavernicola]|uniref:Alpha/beta hydrolase n=1 Tax=Antrihabitans cavernicola TaxID=2495913 RepID=A0A5A7SDX5_9NOCA|nr:alpha/beta hydrolase [Spelaeibacter cavernicola]KAA0022803.1 alpha/beta hydrolase [Spelaeibacter cavernicola]
MTAERVLLEGTDIAYRYSEPQDRIPVVLVHGMGGDSHTWDRFANDLVQRGRGVITLDLRGHGRSGHTGSYLFDEFADDLRHLCDHLELDRVDLVGHSLGGYATSVVAQTRPELVRRLVIEECPLPRRPSDPVTPLTSRFPSVPELWHATTSLIRHPRAVIAYDRSMTSSALTQFRQANPQWWDRLGDITAETLILVGGPGGMVDPIKLEAVVAAIPNCRTVKFKSGHSIHRDKYADFADIVLPFLSAP